jgi:SH3-like domain-containing protein
MQDGKLVRMALLVLMLIVGPAVPAWSMPARVKVFEAIVYAQPDTGSRVLERLAEGSEVSVDEQGERGWRRVRLRDGKGIGWIQDVSLGLSAPEVPAPGPVPVPAGDRPSEPAEADVAAPAEVPPAEVEVAVYRSDLFAEPTRESALVDRLAKGERVKPSEVVGEWTRVETSRGTRGWVRSVEVGMVARTKVSAPTPKPTTAASVEPRSNVRSEPYTYGRSMPDILVDLDQLAVRVRPEGRVHAKAMELIESRDRALWYLVGGVGVSLLGLVAGLSSAESDPDAALAWTVGGTAIGTGLVIAWVLEQPSRREIHEVVNDWNTARPWEPIYWKEPTLVIIP